MDYRLVEKLITNSIFKELCSMSLEAIDKARSRHKKIPYAEIGLAMSIYANTKELEDCAKFFLSIN